MFLALQSVFVKVVTGYGVSTEWMVFVQYLTTLIIITVISAFQNFKSLKTKRIKIHLLRDLTGVLAFTCFVICVRKTDIVDGTLLFNSTPLFIPVVSLIWFRKKIESGIWKGIITGFIGIILIIHPVTGELMQTGEIYGVASGILLAVAYIAMKELTRTESFESILFYYSMTAVVLSMPFSIMNWSNPPLIVWIFVMLSGISFILYLFLLQYAYKFEEATKIAPLNFSTVVFTVIFNLILFKNIPDLFSIAGIVMVSAGGIIAISNHKKMYAGVKHGWH